MEDQLARCLELNIRAALLGSRNSLEERQKIFAELRMYANLPSEDAAGCPAYLLFASPEFILTSRELLDHLRRLQTTGHLRRIVLDELHVCPKDGVSFRKKYTQLKSFFEVFQVPVLALTATATEATLEEFSRYTGVDLPSAFTLRSASNRPNLKYAVYGKQSEDQALAWVVPWIHCNHSGDQGIIYCTTRLEVERIAHYLAAAGISAAPYHAGLETEQRTDVQRAWMQGAVKTIVATIAFGLGVNNQGVCFVIHFSLPKSLEGYAQESGRGGRGGQICHCIVLFSEEDSNRLVEMQVRTNMQPYAPLPQSPFVFLYDS